MRGCEGVYRVLAVGGHRELCHQSLEGGGRGEREEEGDRRCEGV